MKFTNNLKENYSPLYFLSALGAGGLSVTFFMYLVFMTDHAGFPIPTFDTLMASLSTSNFMTNVVTIVAMLAIVVFSVLHFRLLFWNIKEYKIFQETDIYKSLKESNLEVQLMVLPLTFAMTINVLFILGAVFVPSLWNIVEYLFPLAMLAFLFAGYYAIKIFANYSSRVLISGDFDNTKNNNLSQMLGVFAFSMVGVGFSASAAMSHIKVTSGIAMVLAILFLTVAIIFAVVKVVIGFHSMLEHGMSKETSVTLWIVIPITTLIGIAIYRITMGMQHNFGEAASYISDLILLSMIVSVQVLFGYLGYAVMKKMGYFKTFLYGDEKSIAAYALVCPGVAATVMGFFFIHKGLVPTGILEVNSIAYFLVLLPLILLQIKTIRVFFSLNNKLLKSS